MSSAVNRPPGLPPPWFVHRFALMARSTDSVAADACVPRRPGAAVVRCADPDARKPGAARHHSQPSQDAAGLAGTSLGLSPRAARMTRNRSYGRAATGRPNQPLMPS